MSPRDPLHAVEAQALLDEASVPLRHDVRNRMASIRNLAFFVRRKLASLVAPELDPRVTDFLAKIDAEVLRTDEVIEGWTKRVQELQARTSQRFSLRECLRLAIASARLPDVIAFELSMPDDEGLEVECELLSLAFAVRCLLENAGEAVGSGLVSVRAEALSGKCLITVSDSGPGIADGEACLERFRSTKPGHLDLGLPMARRIATRLGGDLLIGSPERGAQVSLLIPFAGGRVAQGAEP